MEFNEFERGLGDKLRGKSLTLFLPEAEDLRIRQAVEYLISEEFFEQIHCAGNPENWPSSGCEKLSGRVSWPWRDGNGVPGLYDYLSGRSAKKSEKGVPDPELVRKQAEDPLIQAGWSLRQGACDGVLAGVLATTSQVIRAALITTGLRKNVSTLSGSFLMLKGNRKFLFADCAVVVDPQVRQLVDIARESVRTWKQTVGEIEEPVVAFLSFSTRGSADHPLAAKMQEASMLFREECPGVDSDGEMQFDAAFDPKVGDSKAPGSPVPGRANIFIFPDLNSGNIGYKLTQRLGNFAAYGPLLQGTDKIYNDLSRGATVKDIVVSAMICGLRALEHS